MTIRLTVPVEESTWKKLRTVAENERTQGRASVSSVIVRLIESGLAQRGPQQ
jgi:hypothetical protein